jgi:hypothetical protein
MATLSQHTFDGLAFPVARVRYSGDSGRYTATIRRDSYRSYRASAPYDHATGGGARGALPAALKCLEDALADLDLGAGHEPSDYIAVPGDLDAGAYVFTFVPAYFFNGHEPRSTARTANGRDLERHERQNRRHAR